MLNKANNNKNTPNKTKSATKPKKTHQTYLAVSNALFG